MYLPTESIQQTAAQFPTPFFLYEESIIRKNCQTIQDAFAPLFPNFQPLYAVKANANPHIVKIIQSEGFGLDCSSLSESWLANKLHATGMHTGNYVTSEELAYVLNNTQLILNLDDASQLAQVAEIGVPSTLSFRVNPGIGNGGEIASNALAGVDAKFGIPHEQIVDAYRQARDLGVATFGIHMMTGSNVLDVEYFGEITKRLLEIIGKITQELDITISFMNIGGGFGVPYRPDQSPLDISSVAAEIRAAYDELCPTLQITEPQLYIEPGRYITADAGWLVGSVTAIKRSYKTYVGLDASSNDMPRPAIYDAYHHADVLTKNTNVETYTIVGNICENNDQLAKDRELPLPSVGELVALHTVGAHGYSMGHNYNGKLRHAEYLVPSDGNIVQIRRAETIEDLFRTTEI